MLDLSPDEITKVKVTAKKAQITGDNYDLKRLTPEEKAEMVWLMLKDFFIKYNT